MSQNGMVVWEKSRVFISSCPDFTQKFDIFPIYGCFLRLRMHSGNPDFTHKHFKFGNFIFNSPKPLPGRPVQKTRAENKVHKMSASELSFCTFSVMKIGIKTK